MKYCPTCGTPSADDDRFCPKCGKPLTAGAPAPDPARTGDAKTNADAGTPRYEQPPHQEPPRYEQPPQPDPYAANYRRPVIQRSVALAIILSLVTCGIYGIYWMVVLTDEINDLTGDRTSASGVVAVVLTIITCGIYGIYWAYVTGRKVAYLNRSSDSGIVNLILALFGLNIINLALFQDAVNRYAG